MTTNKSTPPANVVPGTMAGPANACTGVLTVSSGAIGPQGSPIYVMFYREPGAYDILYDFFGKGLHALMSSNGNVFEFRERFGIIWIQMQAADDYYSKAKPWKPINKKHFYEFVQDLTQNCFYSSSILSSEEVLKMMSDPTNE